LIRIDIFLINVFSRAVSVFIVVADGGVLFSFTRKPCCGYLCFSYFCALKLFEMVRILCLETSTEVCSVALVEDGKVVDYREDVSGQNHSKLLTLFMKELLASNGLNASAFDAVAVSRGPGSYTGLRIGVSAAKGFCYGADIPLMAVSSLQAMASHVVENSEKYGLAITPSDRLVPMIDARRMEVYTAVYDPALNPLVEVNALVVDDASFSDMAQHSRLLLFGNGSAKCKTVLAGQPFCFVDGIVASATHMATLANRMYQAHDFVDVAYFEPFYLKDFIATVPQNKVLNPPPTT